MLGVESGIQHLEAQIIAARRTPEDLAALVIKIESGARGRLADLRTALADKRDLREVFLALFPDGLTFTPARTPGDSRAVWRIEGATNFGSLVGDTLPIEWRPRRGEMQSGAYAIPIALLAVTSTKRTREGSQA